MKIVVTTDILYFLNDLQFEECLFYFVFSNVDEIGCKHKRLRRLNPKKLCAPSVCALHRL